MIAVQSFTSWSSRDDIVSKNDDIDCDDDDDDDDGDGDRDDDDDDDDVDVDDDDDNDDGGKEMIKVMLDLITFWAFCSTNNWPAIEIGSRLVVVSLNRYKFLLYEISNSSFHLRINSSIVSTLEIVVKLLFVFDKIGFGLLVSLSILTFVFVFAFEFDLISLGKTIVIRKVTMMMHPIRKYNLHWRLMLQFMSLYPVVFGSHKRRTWK